MSLFSAIQGSSNALRVHQLGLQVVGNNIANVNTPGYIRQELVLNPALGYRSGGLIIGQGVEAVGVQQKLDNFTLDRLRETRSQLSYQEQVQNTNSSVESIFNELSENDLSSRLSSLANAFQDVANQPGSESMQALVIQRGQEVSTQLREISTRLAEGSSRMRSEISASVDQINRIAQSLGDINRRIVEIEGGTNSDAVGLRDERLKLLDELATYVDVSVTEQPNGSATVFVGGDYIVSDGIARQIKSSLVADEDSQSVELRFTDTDSPLDLKAGRLKGLYESINNSSAEGYQGKIDKLAKDIIFLVNRIHSQGQGSRGFQSVLSEQVLGQTDLPLELANSDFQIDNGSFQIRVTDSRTGETKSFDFPVRQLGQESDTTASELAAAINDVSGLSASITNDGRFEIKSDSPAISFSFANDTSGALAALGINTFFSGNSASTIAVKQEIISDQTLLAVSLDGVGNGAANAIRLSEAFSSPNELLGGRSLNGIYDSIVSEMTRDINTQKGVTDGLRNFMQTLEAKHLGISGVSLDEEAVKMLLYQKAFQATAKVVSAAAELLDTLVNIV
ncbi:MAG: flagellar hook-associated protein FlgK [Pirellula sp.]|jgi:flagellar hook-associated protein 1 FlgK|nr:flagellar hook-associated protein FlgK [Pirellula sp.]